MHIYNYGRIICGDPNELYHHGVKGMRWGERNGPPYPIQAGAHSASEKKANYKSSIYRARAKRADRTRYDVDSIINSMNKDDRDKVLAGSDHYLTLEEGSAVVKRFLKYYGKIPVSFFDILEDGNDTFQLALGTRSGDEYRGKGYASDVAAQAMRWIKKNENHLTQKEIVWGVRVDNIGSIKLAEKNGFVLDKSSYSDDGQWVNYVYKLHKNEFVGKKSGTNTSATKTVTSRVKALRSSGKSYAEIAKKLGISESSVSYYLNL